MGESEVRRGGGQGKSPGTEGSPKGITSLVDVTHSPAASEGVYGSENSEGQQWLGGPPVSTRIPLFDG